MRLRKKTNGYVVNLNDTQLHIARNGGTLGVIGDQSMFFDSDRIKFFVTKPTRRTFPATKYTILQATKCGDVVSAEDHDLKDRKTLNV